MITYYCASQGLSPDEMDYMNFLEDDVLNVKSRFIPLQSSNTQSTKDVGRPESDDTELTEAGEITRNSN